MPQPSDSTHPLAPPASEEDALAAEGRLARLPTKTVLTALGGVAVATGWASTAKAMPAYDHAPPKSQPAADPGTANSAEGPARATPPPRRATPPPAASSRRTATRPASDPGTSTNAEKPEPARDVGTANSAEGPPPGVSTRQLQEDPGTATNAEKPKPARRPAARRVADPGTSTNADKPKPARRPASVPVRDPGTSTNAEEPEPARDVGTANSAEGPPPGVSTRRLQEDPGTANSAEGPGSTTPTLGRQPARPVRSGHPSVPPPLTPAQRAAAQNYVNTLDRIDADDGALRPGTAQQLRRYGADPRAVAEAHRIIAARDASKKRLDNGGVEAEPDPGNYQLTEHGFDDSSTQSTRAMQRTYPRVGLPGVTSDHNRKTKPLPHDPVRDVPGAQGYGWNDGDDDVDYWTPQGLGGQNGEQVTSWYGKGENDGPDDVRVGFTSPDQKGYRFALAVKPNEDGSYGRVGMHAGGAAQYGDYVYLPDTKHGLRVYDTREISEVPKDRRTDSDNYKYLLPEVGSYENTGSDLLYSTVSVDRSNPQKPALVVGEYRNDDDPKTKGDTHVVRWDIDPTTGRLKQPKASAAYVTKRDQVQGAAMDHGNIYLSSSESDTGRLYHGKPGGTIHDSPWSSSPESLYVDRGRLWSLSEHAGERSVFSVPLPKD